MHGMCEHASCFLRISHDVKQLCPLESLQPSANVSAPKNNFNVVSLK